MFLSTTEVVFFQIPFFFFGVLSVIADKSCVPAIESFLHPDRSRRSRRHPLPPANNQTNSSNTIVAEITKSKMNFATMMMTQSDTLLPGLGTTPASSSSAFERGILVSAVQFRSEESMQPTLLLKKFIVTCFFQSIVEAGITLCVTMAFWPITCEDGMVIPNVAVVKLVFTLTNWISHARIALGFNKFSLRLITIEIVVLLTFSIIYQVVDEDSSEITQLNGSHHSGYN